LRYGIEYEKVEEKVEEDVEKAIKTSETRDEIGSPTLNVSYKI